MITIKTTLKQKIQQVVSKKYGLTDFDFQTTYPPQSEMGDYSCNVAMILAKILKKNPLAIGQEIIDFLTDTSVTPIFRSDIKQIKIVQPGFLNFYLSEKHML